MQRTITEHEYCHERLGERFESALSQYDTRRRVETLVESFFTDEMLAGKRVLDVGCGLGFFSQRLKERGADVTACDLGPNLVEETRRRVGCRAEVADALRLAEQFGDESFDVVVSSECIEHTPSPSESLRQMCRVLKPGGYLSVSTPNFIWKPVVQLATVVGARPFDGFENFSSWRSIRHALNEGGVRVVREHGLHLFPFQLGLHRLSTWFDVHAQGLRGLMINLCVLGTKNGSGLGSAPIGKARI